MVTVCEKGPVPGFSFSLPTDTTFTLRNVWSTLDTVQNWDGLHNQLQTPLCKRRKQETVNYIVTTMPSASWQLLAGAVYYLGEQTALTKVTSYFQRQPGMCGRELKWEVTYPNTS